MSIQIEDDSWLSNQSDIIEYTTSFFTNQFNTNHKQSIRTYVNQDNSLIDEELIRMGEALSDREIADAVFSFQPHNAPGPDGIHPFFYQNYWGIVGPSVVAFCKRTWAEESINPLINTTNVCLIPKKKNTTNLKNFKPISLRNTTYKIITKVVVNKIKPILNKIIGPCQASFLKNRQATDNVIIVQEIINHFKKMNGQNGNMIMKIDLEKAFDKLEWSFVKYTLHYFNFPSNIINLIMSWYFI